MKSRLGKYKHFKGNEYRVYGTCEDKENNATYILYKRISDDSGFWLRPIDMFFEQVDRGGKVFDRFTLVEESVEYLDIPTLVARHSETLETYSLKKVSDIKFIVY